jgi:hypothetical protein
MTKYIRIENESDFIFLQGMFDRAINKIKTETSRFDVEQAETIMRIHESLYSATNKPSGEDNAGNVESIDKRAKKRVSKNPKSVRKSANHPTPRLNLCEQHPYYGAVRAPQHDCDGCWKAYKSLNPNAYERKRRDFERKMSKEAK